ncbi:glycoside hydrolase family 19 protein [Megalodesulfovibrio gigas]|uniref:Putative baseplate assembly protein W n=1 Tax=Megalodesulfovibrio gigas (strain ATCC 19364 / DSM 1382 / NCIMB 9332 / VKM B-1759) TaxID=1121448 RepID=T2GCV8_MEGG1|nr:glycoside hydrolase family 19 protein [Megalodesulfovibrio gigas]AGW14118.1 putative baseplate assembly protein W [Megalodesulfovibrio gigas DSM 1382 = ATCC 19364]
MDIQTPIQATINRLCPAAEPDLVKAFDHAGDVLPGHGIGTRLRLQHFLAQVFHETGQLRRAEESLNYTTAARLMVVWPSRFKRPADAMPFVSNPQALANAVYGGRMGNTQPGDGWAYRGRGLLQLTGREMYARVGRAAGLDLETSPELACAPETALLVAATVWALKQCNASADQDDVAGVTRRINGGSNGLQDRTRLLKRIRTGQEWRA